MVFDWLNVRSPFSWCFFAALFFGAAVARASRSHLGNHRWTLIYLLFSGAIAFGAGGLFVPGPSQFLDIRLAYFSVAVAFLGFLLVRSKVAVGVPVVLVATTFLVLFGMSLRGWAPAHGSVAELGRVRILASSSTHLDVVVTPSVGPSSGAPSSGTLPKGTLEAVVETLRFAPYYFFLSSSLLCRFDGVTTSGRPSSATLLSINNGTAGGVPFIANLPGVVYDKIVGTGIEPTMLQDYRVELRGGVDIRLVESSS